MIACVLSERVSICMIDLIDFITFSGRRVLWDCGPDWRREEHTNACLIPAHRADRVLIDGHDLSTFGADSVRSFLAIIPQEPTLYAQSVRFNLDPFEVGEPGALYTHMPLHE